MTPPPGPQGRVSEPLLSQRAVLVLVTAAFLGTIVGMLTLFSTGNAAGAVLASVSTAGASILGLHALIGY